MGVEVAYEMAPSSTEAGKTALHENGKPNDHIKFGSHENGSGKGEINKVSDASFPKDAVDEWPEPQQIHSFYIPRCRPYDDPKIKTKLDHADKEITRWSQARFQVIDKLRAKRSERSEIISQLKPLDVENKQFNMTVGEKRKKMEPLQQALGKLRSANTAGRGSGLCSSEEELNELIQSLNYRIQHESIPLTEEKQILREIKQLEGTRDKVIANAAMRAKLQEDIGEKEVIQDQVKLMGVDLDEVRKDQQALKARIKSLRDQLERVDAEIKSLEEDLGDVDEKKSKAFENMKELRKLRDEGNTHFFENRTLINKAKDLATKKDVRALQELSDLEVEKFMSMWMSNKSFRVDYEKRLLQSLDVRQMSKDGRKRNPEEKPLVAVEVVSTPPELETLVKPIAKKSKEEPKPIPQKETLPTSKVQKEVAKKATADSEVNVEVSASKEKESTGQKKPAVEDRPSEVDLEKLKEMKREEQVAKAKQAMERKKKLAEKNAAKAAIKAQKEAEKKLKEREKKAAKKKGVASAADSEEQVDEAAEVEKIEPTAEAPVPEKEKAQKDKTTVRYRGRQRGSESSMPKIIPKRKKSTNYWIWAAPVVVLVLMLMALSYYYLF